MQTVTVGITGINPVDNPGPGIAVARSLAADQGLDLRLVGLAYDAMEPGLYMDWILEKSFLMPYPSQGGEAYVKRLKGIKDSHGLDFVIPNLDSEMAVFMRHGPELAEYGIHSFVPDEPMFRLRGKDSLPALAEKASIAHPRTRLVYSLAELHQAVQELGPSVMIKGLFYKAWRTSTLEQATERFLEILQEWGAPVLVQEVLAGEEVNLVCLGDGHGSHLGMVAMKKVCTTSLGKVWTGVTISSQALDGMAESFLAHTRWKGPFELECILASGALHLVEINPRFPAWVHFATEVGVNLPARMLRRAFAMQLSPTPSYNPGKLFVRYTMDLVTDMHALNQVVTLGETP